MENSRLIRILKTFKKTDWIQCKRFLRAFSNTGSDTLLIYDYIARHKKNLNHRALQGNKCHQELFSKKDAKSYRNILSRLTADILDYLALDQMRKEKRSNYLHTIENLNNRGLYDLALLHADKYHQLLDQDSINLWTPWYRHRLLHQLKYSDNPQKDGRNSYLLNEIVKNYKKMESRFNSFYELDTCLIQQVEPDELLVDTKNLISYSKSESTDEYTSLYNALIELYHEPSEKLYHQIFTTVQSNDIAETDMIISYVHLRRYLIKRLYEDPEFVQRYADLTLWALQKGFLLNEENVNPMRFSNTIIVLNAASRWSESEKVIRNYGRNLPMEHVNLANANLYSYRGDYRNALDELNKQYDLSLSMRVQHKRLILINLFALYHDNYEFINGQLTNFQSYINRAHQKGDIGPAIYRGNNTMIKVLRSIVKKEIAYENQLVKEYKSFSGRLLITRISKNCGLIT